MKLGKLSKNFKSKTRTKSSSGKSFTFPNFGNLIYYDGLKPNYFYFNSLLSDYERNEPNPRYRSMANQIGQQASSMLSKIPGLGVQQFEAEEKGIDFSTQYQTIIQILQLAIKTECKNEERFIKNKLVMLEKSFNPKYLKEHAKDLKVIKSLLKTLGSGEGIDYMKLIAIINILEQGLENTKSIFQFEAEHLEKLDKAVKENATALERQIRGLAYKQNKNLEETEEMVQHSLTKRNNLRVKTYLAQHHIMDLRGFKKYFKNIAAPADKIAEWMEKVISEQLDKNFDVYSSKINPNGDPRSNAEIILQYLSNALTPIATTELLPKILKTTSDNAIDYRALERKLLRDFDQDLKIEITGTPENFGISKKKLKLFKQRITENNADTRSAEELFNTLQEVMRGLSKKNAASLSPEEQDLITNLGSFYQQEIQPIEQLINKITKLNTQITNGRADAVFSRDKDGKLIMTVSTKNNGEIKTSTLNLGSEFEQLGLNLYQRGRIPANLGYVIKNIKSATSKEIRDKIVNTLINQPDPIAKKDLEDSFSQIIQKIRVSIKGDNLEEIVQGMDHSFTKKLYTGGTFVKNDFMEIIIGMPSMERATELMVRTLTNQLDTIEKKLPDYFTAFSKIITDFQNDFVEAIKEDMKQIQSSKQYTDYDLMAKQYFKTRQEKFYAIEKVYVEYEKAKDFIEEKIKDDQKKEIALKNLLILRNRTLQSIQDTIYESSTMKTYRTYQNDIGFIGGDLGSTVTSQIQSFQQLFEAAGVKVPEDLWDWLISAIINCSSISVIGERNKNFIENYLGSLAIFGIFNEGGAELQILQQQLQDQNLTTNDIMHLYKMNGIYYPGSYILKQVLKNLVPFMNIIEQTETQLKNKNVMIYNPASYNLLPNGEKSKKQGDTHPWQTVGEKVSHSTKIKVLFLAGLLDVVKELHSKIESIELPT